MIPDSYLSDERREPYKAPIDLPVPLSELLLAPPVDVAVLTPHCDSLIEDIVNQKPNVPIGRGESRVGAQRQLLDVLMKHRANRAC